MVVAERSTRHIWFGPDRDRVRQLLLSKIIVDESSGCWLWQQHVASSGYGQMKLPSASSGEWKTHLAHRVFYKEFGGGEVPPGMHLDHKCRVRACVNPEHLEVVTPAENIRRGDAGIITSIGNKIRGAMQTHCVHGHAYTPENTVHQSTGRRRCKTCWKAGFKKYNDAKAQRKRIQKGLPNF